MPQREVVLKGKYRGQTNYSVLTTHLKEHGLLEEHTSYKSALMGPELAIVREYRIETIKFCIEGTMSSKIKSIIKAFVA